MSAILRLSLLTVTIICGATVAASSINQDAGGGGSGTAGFAIESGFRTVYNNYKQCEGDPNMLSCLKLKALKLVDRALAINTLNSP
ncbi:uncharacterized protein LOC135847663 isoform X2 [Planococcus citri]|uniref:uncharacterized protein LOC135847663 isoform X2 n=1 Tax=Planococcus citri TaxID=170843 RepID=UPI0031F85F9C